MIEFWKRAAAMDDPTFEEWAGQLGFTRRPPDEDEIGVGESSRHFRERVIESVSKIGEEFGNT